MVKAWLRDEDAGMSSELLTGAVGLLGAVLGAAGAVWAGSVTAKSQRQQTQDQLEATQMRWVLDTKRDAYMRLLTRASMWQSASWELFNSLRNDVDEEERTEIHRRKNGCWQEFAATSTAAMVFTTDTDVQAATRRMQAALLALDRLSEDRYRRTGHDGRAGSAEVFRARSRECEVVAASLAGRIEAALNLSVAPPGTGAPNTR
ncbi:hypothetical protein [Streptomyces sp. NPDC049813]|uniref:hypothetical protein n=1 Tax=Streptomyces sp. NPDC049813 TaxID=3365597 RepID=UPI00379596DC